MSDQSSFDLQKQIEILAAEFETVYRRDSTNIERFLEQYPSSLELDQVLRVLIPLEIEIRLEKDQLSDASEYTARFQQVDPDWIDSVFAEVKPSTAVRWSDSTKSFRSPPEAMTHETATVATQKNASGSTSNVLRPGIRFGDYEIISEIARGGMGVVYKARQISLNRLVALKMILAGEFASKEEIKRFESEAEAAGNLDHPGIVPIYETGQHNGHPFFSMAFINGESLYDKTKDGTLAPEKAAEMACKIATAIAFAHDKGVIHRDLKPSNVLIDLNGEPRVTDFGLAKKLDCDDQLTGTGQILGTPSYMPPEQAAGDNSAANERADVYALGAILYYLITGRPPFQAASTVDTLLQVLKSDPVPPRQMDARIPRDLETICLKCLNKDPNNRYPCANSLIADLQRYLDHRPIVARPISSWERGWRWCRRNPAAAGLSSVAVILLLASAIGGLIIGLQQSFIAQQKTDFAARQVELRDKADRALTSSEKAQLKTEWMLYRSRNANIQLEWDRGDPTIAKVNLASTKQEFRGWEYGFLYRKLTAGSGQFLNVFSGYDSTESVRYSPSGKLIAVGSGFGKWVVIDASTRKIVASGDAPDMSMITGLAFGPREDSILSSHNSGFIRLWTLLDSRLVKNMKYGSWVSDIALPPESKRLFVGGEGGEIKEFDISSGEEKWSVAAHQGGVESICLLPRSKRLVTGGADGIIKVWDTESKNLLQTLEGHSSNVTNLDSDKAEKQLVSCSMDKTIRFWNLDTLKPNHILPWSNAIQNVRYAQENQAILITDDSKRIHLLDAKTGVLRKTFSGHDERIKSIDFSPGKLQFVSGSEDRSAKTWQFDSPDAAYSRVDFSLYIMGGSVHPSLPIAIVSLTDQFQRADGSIRKEVRIVDGRTGNKIKTIDTGLKTVKDVQFSPDGKKIAFVGLSGDVKVMSYPEEKILFEQKASTSVFRGNLDFSQNGKWLVISGKDAMIFDLNTGERLHTLKDAACSRFSPDGKILVVASSKSSLRFFNTNDWKLNGELNGHTGPINDLQFSQDGRYLVSGGGIPSVGTLAVGVIKVWDFEKREHIRDLTGHMKEVTSLSFDDSGNRIISGSLDGTVRIWDTETGFEVLVLRDNASPIKRITLDSGTGFERLSAMGSRRWGQWRSTPRQAWDSIRLTSIKGQLPRVDGTTKEAEKSLMEERTRSKAFEQKLGKAKSQEELIALFDDQIKTEINPEIRGELERTRDQLIKTQNRLKRGNSLKQCAISISIFDSLNRRLPFGKIGPMKNLSWRCKLLQFSDESKIFKMLQKTPKLNELAWDASELDVIRRQMPDYYGSTDDLTSAFFHVVSDPMVTKIADVRGNKNKTIMLIEMPTLARDWMKPDGLTIDAIMKELEKQPDGFGFYVAMYDGSVHYLVLNDSLRKNLREQLTPNLGSP